MNNGITRRQNEEKSIAMLAAQRQLYQDAKNINGFYIGISVWLPFALSIILLFLEKDSIFESLSYILSFFTLLVSYLVRKFIKNKKNLAAFIQQKFDVYVYQMPWDKRLFGENRNIDYEVANYSKKILSNSKEKKLLVDWYTKGVEDKSINSGIIACQRENLWWDVGLRKRYKSASKWIIFILCAIIITIGVAQNETICKLFYRAAFIVPLLKWLLDTIGQLDEDIVEICEISSKVDDNHKKSMKDLQDIQKHIYNHRKNCLSIPDFFYRFYRDNDEDVAHRATAM